MRSQQGLQLKLGRWRATRMALRMGSPLWQTCTSFRARRAGRQMERLQGPRCTGAATAGRPCTARRRARLLTHAGMRRHMRCGWCSSSTGSCILTILWTSCHCGFRRTLRSELENWNVFSNLRVDCRLGRGMFNTKYTLGSKWSR